MKKVFCHVRDIGLILLLTSCASTHLIPKPLAAPPVAKKMFPTSQIGKKIPAHARKDPYFWMRDPSQAMEYLKAENQYTDEILAPLKPTQEILYREMVERIQETDEEYPVRKGHYLYYTRTEKGKQYSIFCRKFESDAASEQILLNPNDLVSDHGYLDIGVFEVSPNHSILAYSLDLTGNENYEIRFKDLSSGELLSDRIEKTAASLEWASDNRTLFYTVPDETHRSYRVYRHTLGQPSSQDALVYQEDDLAYSVSLYKTNSEKMIFIHSESQITSELRFLDADQPHQPPRLIQKRKKGVEYSVHDWGDSFFMLTNEGAKNFKIVKRKIKSNESWKTVWSENSKRPIENIELFQNHLVVLGRENGFHSVWVENLSTHVITPIQFPEKAREIRIGANPEMKSPFLRLSYSSLTTPESTFDYSLHQNLLLLRKKKKVLGSLSPEDLISEVRYAKSADGALIPITLLYSKKISLQKPHPLWLTGYGAYGMSYEPRFSSPVLSLIARDFIYAIAHVRGGGELGRDWYENGKFLNKPNSFRDLLSVSEKLIADGITAPGRIILQGGSAGGLLVAATAQLRPELFNTVIAEVPFVDVLGTMSDPTLPLTVTEYDEWGNPSDPKFRKAMASYSPYENVKATRFPNLFVTAGLNDTRVGFWEPAKWVARIRDLSGNASLVVLKTDLGAGHFGPSGRYEALTEQAWFYAFALDRLGVVGPAPRKSTDTY